MVGTIAHRFGTIFITRGCFRSAARTVGALAEALCRGDSIAAALGLAAAEADPSPLRPAA